MIDVINQLISILNYNFKKKELLLNNQSLIGNKKEQQQTENA